MKTILPLCINQREIYIDQMMWLEGSHLNIGATVTVLGAFDIEIFNYAMNKVIRTHPGLWTRIYELDGKPLQTDELVINSHKKSIYYYKK